MSEDGEVMLTIKTDGFGRIWAEDARGRVVGLGFTGDDGPTAWEVVEAVASQACAAADREGARG